MFMHAMNSILFWTRWKAIEGRKVATRGQRYAYKGGEGNGCQCPLVQVLSMPLSELSKKTVGLTFDMAAEEMRRLKTVPTEQEWTVLFGLYMQSLHGDIPTEDIYPKPTEGKAVVRYGAWKGRKGMSREDAKSEYVSVAVKMIEKYERSIERSKWNSQVWTVDY